MPPNAPPRLFNRRLYAQRRARAARRFSDHDFLHRRAMEDIVDRLQTVTRSFPHALFYGAGALTSTLTPECGVGEIIHGDLAAPRLSPDENGVIFDEESAPFANHSFDLVVSLLTLHHANDLIGALAQMRAQLKPDGLMIAVLFGADTLASLRNALYCAETTIMGGVSPRITVFANIRDLGACLQRAGFALPVADIDSVAVSYKNLMRLFSDLRGMGEACVLHNRGKPMTRALLTETLCELDKTGGETHFDLVYLTGWAPHDSQQKPLKPGAATSSMEAAVKHQNKS